jgi:cbb3-type cytochrome oxidase maturation protein
MGGETVFYEFLIALCMGLGALCIFIWAVLSGHFEETEDIKHRILRRETGDEQ